MVKPKVPYSGFSRKSDLNKGLEVGKHNSSKLVHALLGKTRLVKMKS